MKDETQVTKRRIGYSRSDEKRTLKQPGANGVLPSITAKPSGSALLYRRKQDTSGEDAIHNPLRLRMPAKGNGDLDLRVCGSEAFRMAKFQLRTLSSEDIVAGEGGEAADHAETWDLAQPNGVERGRMRDAAATSLNSGS